MDTLEYGYLAVWLYLYLFITIYFFLLSLYPKLLI